MRVLGIPIEPPQVVAGRIVSDIGAVARLARAAPAKLDRILELGEELVGIGHDVLRITERLDARVDAIMELGERLDARAEAIMAMGERLDARAGELVQAGTDMRDAAQRIDATGGEIVESATRVVEAGSELITVLPAFERALQMATPLEGAIDRFGRLVDRLPGGSVRRRAEGRAGQDEELPYEDGPGTRSEEN